MFTSCSVENIRNWMSSDLIYRDTLVLNCVTFAEHFLSFLSIFCTFMEEFFWIFFWFGPGCCHDNTNCCKVIHCYSSISKVQSNLRITTTINTNKTAMTVQIMQYLFLCLNLLVFRKLRIKSCFSHLILNIHLSLVCERHGFGH